MAAQASRSTRRGHDRPDGRVDPPLKGIEVTAFGLTPAPYLNSGLLDAIGARYVSTQDVSLIDAAPLYGPFDLIYEATGFAPIVFDAMQALGKNGVLASASVTGGNQKVEVPEQRSISSSCSETRSWSGP